MHWTESWKVTLNPDKIHGLLSLPHDTLSRIFGKASDGTMKQIPYTMPDDSIRFLGVQLDHRLTFVNHTINKMYTEAYKRYVMVYKLSDFNKCVHPAVLVYTTPFISW